ncbi:MAG TPA: glycosyltransferase family 4 protein [Gaiellaceae bacterium]|nr:glycosyltransferase family 4 protein [Gaiellaceae bacterium]
MLYSELALYPIHWQAFSALCTRLGAEGIAYGRDSAALPSVHQQLGWGEVGGDVEFRPIPFADSISRMYWLRRELRAVRPDAIWAQHEPTDQLLMELLAVERLRPGVRIVGAVCENLFASTPLRVQAAGRMLWGRLDALAAVATASIDGARSIGVPASVPARPLVAGALEPPGETQPMDFNIGDDVFVIGFAGRLVSEKGWGVLLEAVEQLPDTFAVAFAGDGPDADTLQAALRSPRLAGRAVYVGLLPRRDLWKFYARLDVLAVPSLTTATWKEQFGGVLADAMAIGLPIVGSSSGAIPEVVGPAGLIVPEGDPGALAAALERLRSNQMLRSELGSVGRRRFEEEFSIDAYSRKLAELVEG